ncbi:MAG: type I-F CRISPR-associated helicase Cas3f [Azoarcus sp.]|jgi:CRISPR-associated endonuclease/helicase Cas3|nr:type I-F CRISPR-associated helicase Cas3f [Azoarcus sp.]
MNIFLVSQCDKRALTETRRILDQFAERRGERVWQTPITQAGLDTLRKLLRKTARKNTAVACHWIRGLDHSELLWIVGDARRFNAEGAVPTNTTTHDVLRREDENDWHTLEDIRLLAQMAALWHDMGKASKEFQDRLLKWHKNTNLYRHEWVSLRLFLAFVGQDDDTGWLERLESRNFKTGDWQVPDRYFRDGLDAASPPPFDGLSSRAPLAAAIAWLIVSHHRLPVIPVCDKKNQQQWLGKRSLFFNQSGKLKSLLDKMTYNWNERKPQSPPARKHIEPYWRFAHGLPVDQPRWREKAAQVAGELRALHERNGKGQWLDNPYAMHLARLALMLADHHYSAQPKATKPGHGNEKLFANTDGSYGKEHLKQPLDGHLLGVSKGVAAITYALPGFVRHLPHLPPHRALRKHTTIEAFRWQNKAADTAAALRPRTAGQGVFIVNMASTGCGKTLANARIMHALADPQQGMRCTFALGLRALTLQTGQAYRQDLRLDEDDLAVLAGGSASRDLFEFYRQQETAAESESRQMPTEDDLLNAEYQQPGGSESRQALTDEGSHVIYDGEMDSDGLLSKAMQEERGRKLLSAAMLVCTIDHLTPATESQRGGRQIVPMLRLMSGDLVLDELDDFDIADLPTVTRLVYWAGLLGARILISSATLPPALVEGLYLAYQAGRRQFQRNRGVEDARTREADIACLWVDEFGAKAQSCADLAFFRERHATFVQNRVKALEKTPPYRRGVLLPLSIQGKEKAEVAREFACHVQNSIVRAHDTHHETCPRSGKKVSFGLVRMANIELLFETALELLRLDAPEGYCIHLCVYHARFPLLLRSAIEARLDAALNRRDQAAVYALPEIRAAIDAYPEKHHIFVVLGSPVTEVGRDHDYDWAVVEPSSMRSLIQLAGRVQRHRQTPCPEDRPNIFVFEFNLRHFYTQLGADGLPSAAFIHPGFEEESEARTAKAEFRLYKHNLAKLLQDEEYKIITARPRIQPRAQADWQPKQSLVDLEHARLFKTMMPDESEGAELNAASSWQLPHAALTWALPQQQPFRDDDGQKEIELLFLPDKDDEQKLILRRIHRNEHGQTDRYLSREPYFYPIDLANLLGKRIFLWGQNDLLALLQEQAKAQTLSLYDTALRFTRVKVPDVERSKGEVGWRYHSALGFAKK